MSVGFTLSEIEIVIPQDPKPEVPMFDQTMSLLLMIKEQKVFKVSTNICDTMSIRLPDASSTVMFRLI